MERQWTLNHVFGKDGKVTQPYVMDRWLKVFEAKCKEAGIEMFLITKYVDDVLIICDNLHLGQYWEEGRIKYCQIKDQEDEKSGKSRSEITYGILKEIANSVMGFLKFTGEVALDSLIPVLDIQLWVGPSKAKGP